MKRFDIDVASPTELPGVLREAAQKYREDASELAAMWQDPMAGRIWLKLADRLDATANRCEQDIARFFK